MLRFGPARISGSAQAAGRRFPRNVTGGKRLFVRLLPLARALRPEVPRQQGSFAGLSRLADLINEAQLHPVQMINSGLGANVVSERSAYYEQSGKPAAMLRYQKHVIDYHPDLVLISFGLNDARAGTPVGQFIEDLRKIVLDVKAKTGAVDRYRQCLLHDGLRPLRSV